ncbi:MAG TPA: AI-2E family transporter [Candidatus Paceibacterota bacterium]|nr:AI-2E family transporter [Candidatus Paceibacterota bacterium]
MKNPGTRIEITTGTIARAILLALLTIAMFALKDIILVVLTAVVIASAIEPGIHWLMDKKIPRIFSALIIYGAVAALVVSAFYTVIPRLLEDTSEFLSSVPQYIESSSLWNPLGNPANEPTSVVAANISHGVQTTAQNKLLITATGVQPDEYSIQGVLQSIDEAISSVSAGFVHSASSVFGGVLSFILIVVLSFYLAVQEDGVEKLMRVIIPDPDESYAINLWRRVRTKIGLWMQGQIVLALLVGILVYLGLLVLGVKNALLFAVLAAALEMIPLFGPILAAVPAVAASYNDGGTSSALIVAGLYLIVHQFENHLIYPLVVKKIVGVHPILVIISLLVGYKLAGFLGIILSVPASTLLVELIDDMERGRTKKQPKT